MKVWISKYALSSGITEHEAEVKNGWAYPGKPFASYTGFVMGKDAHDTPEGAIAAAMAARGKKIASVKKQLAKLERMTFSVPNAKSEPTSAALSREVGPTDGLDAGD